MEKEEIGRYRTIPNALKYIKSIDEDSAITEYAIRNAIKKRQLRCRYIGRRIIIDLADLDDFYQRDKK